MRNMGVPRREQQNNRIDWAALVVVIGCSLGVISGLAVIAKYIFRSFSGG
jgi:hypothetical protein